MLGKEPARLKDSDIRGALHIWLQQQHVGDTDTNIIHELPIPRPSARVDIALVNGELCGFEIKSDVDTLCRLPRQIASFSSVFDRVSIVTTSRHLKAVRHVVPKWWGICLANQDGTFSVRRKGSCNRKLNTENLLYLLSKNELSNVIAKCPRVSCRKSVRRSEMVRAILMDATSREIRDAVRYVLKMRRGKSAHASSSDSLSASKLMDIWQEKSIWR